MVLCFFVAYALGKEFEFFQKALEVSSCLNSRKVDPSRRKPNVSYWYFMIKKKTIASSKKARSKTTSKRASSIQNRMGKLSSVKGKNFEDQVADLYRLLGARVVQNIEIHQKKVDILATFRIPGSSREHSVIVECKDETRQVAANQRIMAFKGLLDTARVSGTADSAEIITRTPWSDQAKGFARSSGVELFTYTEKMSQLIDFTGYLKALVSKFDKQDPARPTEPPLASYYVDLSAQKGSGDQAIHLPVIDACIHEWLNREDLGTQLAIFGEYGSGKSTLCQKLARDLAAAYLAGSGAGRIPILLNLRDFIGKLDLEAYITSFLDRECKVVNPRIELFRAMNEVGIFLLIFDGFDEMAVKVDADTLESNLLEIEKLAASHKGKLMLTSRPEYFVSAREESEVLTPPANPFLIRTTHYEPLKILPWNEGQVELFLQQRVPLVKEANQPWTYYRDRIKNIGSLPDLSQRPVLLEMIVKTLPQLISSGETINLPNLYKSYLIGEMKRQKVLKKRSFLLTDAARLELLQELAAQIFRSPAQSITFADAMKLVETEIAPPKQELEAHTRDFLTNSFLIRNGDEYRLSHKSILEFLVAMKLNEKIEENKPAIFHAYLNSEILDFVKEFEPDQSTLLTWIELSKDLELRHTRLGANAAELLLNISRTSLLGEDLSGVNLSNANLSGADLRTTTLSHTLLTNSVLNRVKFYWEDVQTAKFASTDVSFHILKSSKTRGYGLGRFKTLVLDALERADEDIPLGFFEEDAYRPDLFWEVTTPISAVSELEILRDLLTSALKTPVAVFWDEFEQLAREADSEKSEAV